MLIQMLIQQPRMLAAIVDNTPGWVWALLAGLLALGVSQLFPRRVSRLRAAVVPVAMAGFALFGIATAFAGTGQPGRTVAAWLCAAAGSAMVALWLRPAAQPGSRYHAPSGQFDLPGSAMPLVLILGIFLTKYTIGVQLAIQPALARDATFALTVAAVYGLFNGIFAARLLRLWYLTRHREPIPDAIGVHPET